MLCAVEPRLRLKKKMPGARLELGAARSAGQRFTYYAAGAPVRKQCRP